jgi:hypothetical protein
VEDYAARFEAVRVEVGMTQEEAKDILIRGLSDAGLVTLNRRMDGTRARVPGDRTPAPVDEVTARVSYDEILDLLSMGESFRRP